jgi:general secretion pathway protein A
VLAGAGLAWALQQPWATHRPAEGAPAAGPGTAASAASAASAALPASAPASAASAPAVVRPAVMHLADWTPDDAGAWQALADRWGLPLPAGADACTTAQQRGLQCYRSSTGSLSLVRLIDRPVLLTLQRPGQPAALVAVVGLDAQHATVVVAGQARRLPLDELASAWRGEFATFWRPPPGYANRASNIVPLREWLGAQLATLQAAAAGASAASAPVPGWPELSRQIQAFQAARGLQPDGRVGPVTLMLINQATDVPEPRLDPAS